jgi:hypothetical protein
MPGPADQKAEQTMASRRAPTAPLDAAPADAPAHTPARARVLLPALLLPALLLPLGGAGAQMLCSKPLQPLCSTTAQSFADETEKQRCLGDADRYLEELGEYRACLQEAMDSVAQSVERAEAFRKCLEESGEACSLEADSNL